MPKISNSELKTRLIFLADKYETADFIKNDPSQFMHRYSDVQNQEVAAFIAANLSFGRREQIISHVDFILSQSENPLEWILSGGYESVFPESEKSFYRMFSFKTMRIFFDTLRSILQKNESLGGFFKKIYEDSDKSEHLCRLISSVFPDECTLIPRTKSSAAKRLNMFLRWMVRDSSPVDLGLWTWFDKKNLLMPMDTHVIQESVKFGLLPKSPSGKIPGATMKNALALTDFMKTVFPDDPVRGDFALFGLGVDS